MYLISNFICLQYLIKNRTYVIKFLQNIYSFYNKLPWFALFFFFSKYQVILSA